MSTIIRRYRNEFGTRTPTLYEMIVASAASREKIKRASKTALFEWFAQSERLVIARDYHKLKGPRWVDFARRCGVDRTSAYRLTKLWPFKAKVLKRCREEGHYPGWETCLYWFMPDPRRHSHPGAESGRYWLTPSDLKAKLEHEYPGHWDACPYPRPKGFDALAKKDWPPVAYVNAPFFSRDEAFGRGMTTWVRKVIAEAKKGTTVMMVIPTFESINLMLEAGAEVRSLGRVKWRDIETGEPSPHPHHSALFIIRGTKR